MLTSQQYHDRRTDARRRVIEEIVPFLRRCGGWCWYHELRNAIPVEPNELAGMLDLTPNTVGRYHNLEVSGDGPESRIVALFDADISPRWRRVRAF